MAQSYGADKRDVEYLHTRGLFAKAYGSLIILKR